MSKKYLRLQELIALTATACDRRHCFRINDYGFVILVSGPAPAGPAAPRRRYTPRRVGRSPPSDQRGAFLDPLALLRPQGREIVADLTYDDVAGQELPSGAGLQLSAQLQRCFGLLPIAAPAASRAVPSRAGTTIPRERERVAMPPILRRDRLAGQFRRNRTDARACRPCAPTHVEPGGGLPMLRRVWFPPGPAGVNARRRHG